MNQSLILAISSSYWLAHNFLPSPIDLWIKAYRGRWCQQGQVVSEMAEIWSVNGQLYFEGCVWGGGGWIQGTNSPKVFQQLYFTASMQVIAMNTR